MGRVARADEIAAMVAFLACPPCRTSPARRLPSTAASPSSVFGYGCQHAPTLSLGFSPLKTNAAAAPPSRSAAKYSQMLLQGTTP